MHGKLGLLSQGKASSHSTALASFSPLRAMFPCFQTTGCEAYSFTIDGYEIFNVRTHVGACCSHEWGSGTNMSAQELNRRDKTSARHAAPPRGRTQGLGISDSLPAGLCPPSGVYGYFSVRNTPKQVYIHQHVTTHI